MKPAICSRCGKDLKDLVPDDAEDVVCFRCNEAENKRRERQVRLRSAQPALRYQRRRIENCAIEKGGLGHGHSQAHIAQRTRSLVGRIC
jgi:hypothetical protein